jgi:Putative polyhydroxyalkanoic acid system protein (PHA_gran_rgn)
VGICCSAAGWKTDRNSESSFVSRRHAALFFSENVELHSATLEEDPMMSAPLVVSIPHRLGREEATRRLKAGLTRAASSIPVLKVDEERWEEDRMIFRVRALGQAVSGHLDVADDHVRLEVTLPWLLQRFAEAAQVAIRNRGNLLLTKRG